jgi:hypothetical protein
VEDLYNATCLKCHDGRTGKLEMLASNGEKRAVKKVVPHKFANSVHGDMDCVACHLEITDSTAPHKKSTTVKKAECAQCHLDLWEETKKLGKAAEKPRLGIVADNVAAYRKSFHAKPDKDDPTKLMAICSDCHDVHTFDVPPRGTQERKEWHLKVPEICGKCHEDHLEEWSASIHGKEALEKKNEKTAVCSDCHTTHDIIGSSTEKAKASSRRRIPSRRCTTRIGSRPARNATPARKASRRWPPPASSASARTATATTLRSIPRSG